MVRLLSWIGFADFTAWKSERAEGDGPLLGVAKHVKATEIDLLWDDVSRKVPISQSGDYAKWLEQQLGEAGLRSNITVRPCAEAKVMDFAWVYAQLEKLRSESNLERAPLVVNASSGTPMMFSCWIIFKKSTGLDLRLFRSSPEKGVESLELPANLAIDITEVLQARRSGLFDRYVRGEIKLQHPDLQGLIGASDRAKEAFPRSECRCRVHRRAALVARSSRCGKDTARGNDSYPQWRLWRVCIRRLWNAWRQTVICGDMGVEEGRIHGSRRTA